MKHAICRRWLANPNWCHSFFPHNFWSSYEYLYYLLSKWRFLCSFNGHIGPLGYVAYSNESGYHILSTLSNLFQAHVFFVLSMGASCLFGIQLKYIVQLRKSDLVRSIYMRGWSFRYKPVRMHATLQRCFGDVVASWDKTLVMWEEQLKF